ncbi:hypothetical protein CHUAL_006050 [Chamberlinius hualienensis]
MCGRTACTLQPEDICRASCYKDDKGNWKKPEWRESSNRRNYNPSFNIAPTSHTPVMVSRKYLDEDEEDDDIQGFVIQPMHWGLIPHWHKGSYKEFTLNLNNARSETILSSRLFNEPLKAGKRCVVIVDGYYEWQSSAGGGKQPFFIYFPQSKSLKIENDEWKNGEFWNETDGWLGPRLLTMAGIFDTWNDPDNGKTMFSYSIITMEASSAVNMVHERMPAVLDGWEAIRDWLDYKNVSVKESMKLIIPSTNLMMHPVTKQTSKKELEEDDDSTNSKKKIKTENC